MDKGTLVKLTEQAKDDLVKSGSVDHINEFGDCIGVIISKVNSYGEVDVRWSPSNLKYMYFLSQLEVV